MTAIHQNHDYVHIAKDVQGMVVDQQTKRNEELSGGLANMLIMKDRTHVLDKNGIHVALENMEIYTDRSNFIFWYAHFLKKWVLFSK